MIKSYKPYKVKRKFFFYEVLKDNDGRIFTVWFDWCLVLYKLKTSYFLGNYPDNQGIQYFNYMDGLPFLNYSQYQALKEYFNGKK